MPLVERTENYWQDDTDGRSHAAKHDPNKKSLFQQDQIMSVPLCAWLGCVNLQFGQQTCTGWSSWPGPAGPVSSSEVSLDPSHLIL